MNIAIRADASELMGSGHVMRCLTLADALTGLGADVSFICRELKGHYGNLIRNKGFPVILLPRPSNLSAFNYSDNQYARWLEVAWEQDALETRQALKSGGQWDWLIVDHYALDGRWETEQRKLVKKIMVIDDLINRHHECDLLVNQNYYPDMELKYKSLVPKACSLLLGPEFAMLRPEFAVYRHQCRHGGPVKRILIFFGGVDGDNMTGMALDAVLELKRPDINVDVVVGNINPNIDELQKRCETLPEARIHIQVDKMSYLMAEADLSIGAGGSTGWERCAMGLPSVIVSIADNQVPIAKGIADKGAGVYLGTSRDVTLTDMLNCLEVLVDDAASLERMSSRASEWIDANGCSRVADSLISD